ncbi:1-acyl-sn-glycerol-3-phosphate acyltransferase alpha-like [Lytechinus pictus]|uniref:1-acyl-sn-glycerol-3-phosphate acyltransferase alpha-like n=1 Tax=Lytechinus pictus TaxID=7653 RepID=UPI00240DA15A|nr:1-acyl-sn-glycerol-3-phosphate acyltransferase alpha-like [Lytechinus pictus]
MTWDAENKGGDSIGLEPSPGTDSSLSSLSLWITLFTLCAIVIISNRKLRFYMKYHAFTGIYFFFGIICVPFMLFNPCDPKAVTVPIFFARWVQSPLFGISAKIIGMERYPDGPFVIVCNHQSSLDCLGLVELWPPRSVIIMKKMLKYAGPFGICAILAGTIFVERNKNRSTRDNLKDAVEVIKRKGYRVFFFPEGTRRLTQKNTESSEPMLPFKKGAFNVAILTQVPIVPIVFQSQKHLIDFKKYIFVPGEYKGVVLPPISTEGLTLDDAQDLCDRVRAKMIDCFNELENGSHTK